MKIFHGIIIWLLFAWGVCMSLVVISLVADDIDTRNILRQEIIQSESRHEVYKKLFILQAAEIDRLNGVTGKQYVPPTPFIEPKSNGISL